MNLTCQIDPESGFCYGVIRAVQTAEENLLTNGRLFSLGSIVHNNAELDRLQAKGLSVIDIEKMKGLRDVTVLIRAHGEPPETYRLAAKNNIRLIDCTCPVVLKLQERIRSTWRIIGEEKGQIVIFGKKGHAEVNGLVGQVSGNAIVLEGTEGEEMAQVDFSRTVHIFSQTTKDPGEFEELCNHIRRRQEPYGLVPVVHNTICRRVALRHKNLKEFAQSHSVILFVSGLESSNGKVLFDLCKSVNSRSYFIQDGVQIDPGWFRDGDSVGICGATSTPKWQLESVAASLKNL